MGIATSLEERWGKASSPFLVSDSGTLSFEELKRSNLSHLAEIEPGDVVALIGDFTAQTIAELIYLVDHRAVVVPLTSETRASHDYFFESALVDWVIEGSQVKRVIHGRKNPTLHTLRERGNPGLILFSTGTTGRPKAILHDMSAFLRRFETPRPTFRTLSFLLFDHIGGLNTLFHTLYNMGVVITTRDRSVGGILDVCARFKVEVLPTTPTFLRMMLMSGSVPDKVDPSLRVITYGTERMDQSTLESLCDLLPNVDFRQTFGMSELGILRVKSKDRRSLFMKVGGEGVQTRIVNGELEVRSATRMLGYLNAESPFDADGWYRTHDLVETDGDYFKVVGRSSEVINVGGQKFMASEVERVAMQYEGVALASVEAKENPITGQHVELKCEMKPGISESKEGLRAHLARELPAHMVPRRIVFSSVEINHRFKRS